MDNIDALVYDILRGMGVNKRKPPRWIPRIHKAIDRTTGEVVREYEDGFICSHCGKHSWWKQDKCDGCHAIMPKE